jgi:alkyl hydroperoxide reductase subunit AhpC
MLTIGDKFPDFELTGVVSNDAADAFQAVNSQKLDKQWKVVFFWPKDFTFVCPTEIAAFGRLNDEFADRDAQVLGVSVDSEFVHLAWRRDHKDLVDQDNTIQFAMVTAGSVGRNVDEVLRVLDALQTDELCPCNWQNGQETLDAAKLMAEA